MSDPASMPRSSAIRAEPLKQVAHSFSLNPDVLATLDRLAVREAKGARPNKSAIVNRALRTEFARVKIAVRP